MPIYEYKCNSCGHCFEQLVFPSDNENDFSCPSCGKQDISRLVSSFSSISSGGGSGLNNAVSSACSSSGGFS